MSSSAAQADATSRNSTGQQRRIDDLRGVGKQTLLEGESFEVEGVMVAFLGAGAENDLVRISQP
jgi:hypothetical protein